MELGQYTWDPEQDLIAHGAFAEVFKAKDTNASDRYVALKIYKEAVAKGTITGDSLQKKYSLEREFSQIDSLSHTNIISFYGLDYIHHTDMMGRSSSYPVIVMELATEGTLVDFMKTNPDRPTVIKLIQDMIRGVDYLHSEGMLHRDMKPGNVLVTRNRRGEPVAKITDFGISRDLLTDKTIEQSMTEGVGTPHYMAPEQFFKKNFGLNGDLSERTDIWGLGVIIYWMLSGKLPFGHESKDYEEIREQITTGTPDYDIIPLRYVNLLKGALAKKAENRIASTHELYAALPEPTTNSPLAEGSGAFTATVMEMPTSLSGPQPVDRTALSQDRPPVASKPEKKAPKKKRVPRVLVILITLLVLSSGSYFGYGFYMDSKIQKLLDSGWNNYLLGNHKSAYEDYVKASEFNSPEAFHHLSTFYQIGYGTARDYERSRDMAQKAVDLGYDMSAFNLGWAYQRGEGVPIDTVKAQEYFENSVTHITDLAEKNNSEALNLLGLLYYFGYGGMEQDYDKSFEWTAKSAEQGNPSGMSNLANCYEYGQGTEVDYEKSFSWYEKAAKLNSYRAYYGLGNHYYYGRGVDQDYEKAYNNYKIAADNGNSEAQNSIGYMYNVGYFVKKNNDEALWWYRKAAEGGNITAQTNVGIMFENSEDYSSANNWYSKAANNNSSKAMYRKGLLFQDKLDNYDSAYYWYIKSANNNYLSSQFKLGYNFSNGIGNVTNIDSAVHWYTKAVDLGSAAAQNNLGLLYKNGSGSLNRDYNKAFELFQKAANGDNALGAYNLGEAYYNGQGTTKNYGEALKWYRVAEKSDVALAIYSIGYMYYQGHGVRQDYATARTYFRRAANGDNLLAQLYLADMYTAGKGGEEDLDKARYWYQKAADRNSSWAQYKLGLFYYAGLGGLSKSKQLAGSYLRKACNQGQDDACKKVKELF